MPSEKVTPFSGISERSLSAPRAEPAGAALSAEEGESAGLFRADVQPAAVRGTFEMPPRADGVIP
jgi:hypothetical protein